MIQKKRQNELETVLLYDRQGQESELIKSTPRQLWDFCASLHVSMSDGILCLNPKSNKQITHVCKTFENPHNSVYALTHYLVHSLFGWELGQLVFIAKKGV